jgi:hypothetical protein
MASHGHLGAVVFASGEGDACFEPMQLFFPRMVLGPLRRMPEHLGVFGPFCWPFPLPESGPFVTESMCMTEKLACAKGLPVLFFKLLPTDHCSPPNKQFPIRMLFPD